MIDSPIPTSHAATPRQPRHREKTAWWITFSALTISIFLMLSLWN